MFLENNCSRLNPPDPPQTNTLMTGRGVLPAAVQRQAAGGDQLQGSTVSLGREGRGPGAAGKNYLLTCLFAGISCVIFWGGWAKGRTTHPTTPILTPPPSPPKKHTPNKHSDGVRAPRAHHGAVHAEPRGLHRRRRLDPLHQVRTCALVYTYMYMYVHVYSSSGTNKNKIK